MAKIFLAEWAPDQPPLNNPNSGNIKNAFPAVGGYKPIPSLATISTNALGAVAKGYFSAKSADGSIVTFAAASAKLYSYASQAFTDVSKVAGYNLAAGEFWEYAQFGTRVIATNIADAPQYFDVGSSSLFADLTGSPPQARHVGLIRDSFVVFANTTNSPAEVFWSGDGDSTSWTIGTNQCDSQTLNEGGWINGFTGGDVGYVFQDKAITRMSYVGPPVIMQFDTIEKGRGLAAPYSLVRIGSACYYWGTDGFKVLDCLAGATKAIGSQRVDDWFRANADPAYITRMRGAIDYRHKVIWWSFISINTADSTHPDMAIGYNYELDRWFYTAFSHELITPGLTDGVTLEGLGSIYATLEAIPVSLDSSQWTGGAFELRAFTDTHSLATFTGSNLEAVIETAEAEFIPGARSLVTNIRPLSDTAAVTASISSRERLADTAVATVAASMQANGDISLLSSGRSHKITFDIPAGTTWTYIQGADVDAVPDGLR